MFVSCEAPSRFSNSSMRSSRSRMAALRLAVAEQANDLGSDVAYIMTQAALEYLEAEWAA